MTKEYLESSHAAADGYRSYLVERYQGEVYGEALFQAMAAGCNDAERVGKLRLLERLERETKEFLRPALVETGGLPTESAERIREGQTLGSQLASAPWADLMQGFQQEIQRFVEELRRPSRSHPPARRRCYSTSPHTNARCCSLQPANSKAISKTTHWNR